MISRVREELGALSRLAWPIVIAEMGWLLTGVVDTVMVGPLGPAAIGAVGTGTIIFLAIMMPGFGTLLALDTFVAQAFGQGRIDECHRWLVAGLQVATAMAVLHAASAMVCVWLLPSLGFHPDVLALIEPYMTHLVWSTLPLFVYGVCRRYLQALHIARPIVVALLVANVLNAAVNWVLIYGHLGLPALGVVGAAYATVAVRFFLAVFCLAVIASEERRRRWGLYRVPLAIEGWRVRRLMRIGAPAAGQILLEVGVFAVASALAGRMTPVAVAAHQIVLNVVGFVFMIPYGIGSAAAVRVAYAMGRRDAAGARRAGWVACGLAVAIMALSATALALVPRQLLALFTVDPGVLTAGTSLILVAAVFQVFDGLQAVTTGALRGLGETRVPMAWNLAGHWLLGLPVAWSLAVPAGWGVVGLWIGLAAGLVVIGTALTVEWHWRSRALHASLKIDLCSPHD